MVLHGQIGMGEPEAGEGAIRWGVCSNGEGFCRKGFTGIGAGCPVAEAREDFVGEGQAAPASIKAWTSQAINRPRLSRALRCRIDMGGRFGL